jgi:hypothetical protein
VGFSCASIVLFNVNRAAGGDEQRMQSESRNIKTSNLGASLLEKYSSLIRADGKRLADRKVAVFQL